MLDFLWVIGSLIVVGIWVFLYFKTRKKIFILIALITVVADFFTLKDMGITLKTFTDFLI